MSITLTVVGGDTIQEGMDAADCEALDWTDFDDEIAAPEVTGLVATVVDDDGTELTGIWIYADSDDTDVVNVTLDPVSDRGSWRCRHCRPQLRLRRRSRHGQRRGRG